MDKKDNNKDSNKHDSYIGIYVHIPFCKSKCSYCDFLSFECKNEYLKNEYIDAIIKEIDSTSLKIINVNNIFFNSDAYEEIIQELEELEKHKDNNDNANDNDDSDDESTNGRLIVDTIYFGGGTPSLIDADDIKRILDAIKKEFIIVEDPEITIEVNPESINEDKLKTYKEIGINRISIGLQTTNNNLLKQLGRIHTFEEFKEKYYLTRKYFNNINIDLMFGLPKQDIVLLKKDIEELINLNPEHISTYSLILEENTKLYKEVKNFNLKLPSDNLNRDMYWYIKKSLEANGYIHYEISNFSKKSFESKHNINCWKQKEYFAFGVNGASYFNNVRFSNITNLPLYIENVNNNSITVDIDEIQNFKDKEKEFVLLGLRMIEGFSVKEFEDKFDKSPLKIFEVEINELIKKELIIIQDTDNDKFIKLTNKGLDLANIVWEYFI